MGMYTWLNEHDIELYSKVTNKELDELFQEVRGVMPHVFISESITESKSFFGKKKVKSGYRVYHAVGKTGLPFLEVRCMNLNFSSDPLLYNYLCGLVNGYHANKK